VLLKFQVFWDVTLCCWASTSGCFEGLLCLHLRVQAFDYLTLRGRELLAQHHSVTSQKTLILKLMRINIYWYDILSDVGAHDWVVTNATVGYSAAFVCVAGLSAGGYRPVQGRAAWVSTGPSSHVAGTWKVTVMIDKRFWLPGCCGVEQNLSAFQRFLVRLTQGFRIYHWLIQQLFQIKSTYKYRVNNYEYWHAEWKIINSRTINIPT
jgi:hypothetical protein